VPDGVLFHHKYVTKMESMAGSVMPLPPFDHDAQTKFTDPPNSTWSFCQKIENTDAGRRWLEGEKKGWKVIDTEEEDKT